MVFEAEEEAVKGKPVPGWQEGVEGATVTTNLEKVAKGSSLG